LLIAAGLASCGGQPLEVWHTASFAEEFVAGKTEIESFDDYLALEERLFVELVEKVYAEVETGPGYALARYSAGSAADPGSQDTNYNRSYELQSDAPNGGVLLLHGMSDSPYSLRALGKTLNEQGYWVLAIRLPGHGTAPSGLRRVRWEDMAAATRIAATYLAEKVGDRPIHMLGYSTGSALALNHALDALDDAALPRPASLVLVSPAIGISRAAALAGPKATLGRAPGFGRLAFTEIQPEFDPFKYNSFATNAGSQVHRLTRSVADRVARLARDDRAAELPPILVFKSTVDATVSVDAVVDSLLARLPANGNELVLFDINRKAVLQLLLVEDPGPFTRRLMRDPTLPFAVRLVANESPESADVVSHYKPALSGAAQTESLGLAWPPDVISLSHVALNFPPDDPLYGRYPPADPGQLFLGQAEIRGERGLLRISTDWLLRLRYNPFYEVLEGRVLEWFGETGPGGE
jgi:alpha-beta hydrolase superfamily lysophospholipase